ncbi:MAG: glycosyltransferase family 4 protein [bacterium]
MSKRVLIFSLAYYPDLIGGAEVAIKEITDRIPGSELEFDMVTCLFNSELPRHEKIGNINIYRVGFGKSKPTPEDLLKFPLVLNKYLFPFFSYVKAVELNKVRHYDTTWAMMANYAGFGAMFFKLFHSKISYLLSLQEGDPVEYIKKRVRFAYPLFERIFTKADRIQTISNYLAGFAKEMGYKGEIEVIPNGVDIEKFSKKYSEEELDNIKHKLGKRTGDVFIVTASRLVKKNAISDVINSLLFLPNNYKFIILGSGPDLNILKKLVESEKLNSRVKFLGLIAYSELPGYLKASDIFIRPSLSEGMGNSFVEAMAAEIPVIATPVGGIVDFLFDPDKNKDKKPTGLFCDVSDPKSISEKVLKITKEPELKNKLVRNAKELVAEKYNWNIIAQDMLRLFKEIC